MSRAACLRAAAAFVLLAACRESPPPASVQPAAAPPTSPPARTPHAPRSQQELPTTDPLLAVSSFLNLYDQAIASDAAHPERPPPAALVSLLLSHAQFFGTLADYDRALAAAERSVRLAPAVPEAYLQRANARQALHLFDEALADLAAAQQAGTPAGDLDGVRAGILQALGRQDEALTLRRGAVAARRTTSSVAALAQLLGEMGQAAEAERLFIEAQDRYADVSPFVLAWVWFQAGLLAEREGHLSDARALYEEAHARLPLYAPVAAHLASLVALRGNRTRAIELLQPIVRSSDDPEYLGQLGALLRDTGETARGTELVARARDRYEELVRRWPAAFSDHAARFWLGPGGDPKLALVLARQNATARQTHDAVLLVIEAAIAARAPALACETATLALRMPRVTPRVHLRAAQAFTACGDHARAEAEVALATKP